jgi:hypothetical protein
VNRLRPDLEARQIYTVILPFMVIIQRYQPGSSGYFAFLGRNFEGYLSDEEVLNRHYLIFQQDRAVVESQRPEELPLDLSEELHLRGPDSPAIEYRRRLRALGVDWA